MNSTKILFLNMLKSDIINATKKKMGVNNVDNKLLTGQTISLDEIKSFSSYKLMNTEEREIIDFILTDMKKKDSSMSNNKVLSKHINGLVPKSSVEYFDFRDSA